MGSDSVKTQDGVRTRIIKDKGEDNIDSNPAALRPDGV